MKTLDEAYQRFYSLFLFKTEPEEVKYAPEETLEHGDDHKAAANSEENQVETFEYSDDDIMSDDDDDDKEDNDPVDDRAAAISNILNILADN